MNLFICIINRNIFPKCVCINIHLYMCVCVCIYASAYSICFPSAVWIITRCSHAEVAPKSRQSIRYKRAAISLLLLPLPSAAATPAPARYESPTAKAFTHIAATVNTTTTTTTTATGANCKIKFRKNFSQRYLQSTAIMLCATGSMCVSVYSLCASVCICMYACVCACLLTDALYSKHVFRLPKCQLDVIPISSRAFSVQL